MLNEKPGIATGPLAVEDSAVDKQDLTTKAPGVNAHTPALAFALHAVKTYGWYVFPLDVGEKTPAFGYKWTRRSTNDPEGVLRLSKEYPGCNWGVNLEKSGLLVIDVDGKGGDTRGRSSYSRLDLTLGLDLEDATFVVKTPSGWHYYLKGAYRTSSTVELKGERLELIDFKSVGGYVVLPGSVYGHNGDAKSYTVFAEREPAPVPAALAALLEPAGTPEERERARLERKDQEPDDGVDAGGALGLALDYLGRMPEAGQGERNNAAFQRAAQLRNFGLSFETAVTLMLNHNQFKFIPPGSPSSIITVVSNAYKYATGTKGEDSLEFPDDAAGALEDAGFDDTDGGEDAATGLLALITDPEASSARRFLEGPLEPIKFHFHNSLPEGSLGLLAGPGGAGKSFWLLAASCATAGGIDAALAGVFTLADPTPGRVLAVFAEDSDAVLAHRVNTVLDAYAPKVDFEDNPASKENDHGR